MKTNTLFLKLLPFILCIFTPLPQKSFATTNDDSHEEKVKKAIASSIHKNITVVSLLPIKKINLSVPFYKDLFDGDNAFCTKWMIFTILNEKGNRGNLYEYDALKLNERYKIMSLFDSCNKKVYNNVLYSKGRMFVGYFFDADMRFEHAVDEYFLVTLSDDDNITLQSFRSGDKYSIDSLIIFKYGSFEKYIELIKEEDEEKIVWLETPKTFEEACFIMKKDYDRYFQCYPDDTATAVAMLIDEVVAVAHITDAQKRLLERNIASALNRSSEWYYYMIRSKSMGADEIRIGSLYFYEILKRVLTKSQMDIYLSYYHKQKKIRRSANIGLFGIFGTVPKYTISWDNYRKNIMKYYKTLPDSNNNGRLSFYSDYKTPENPESVGKYIDPDDFLRKEVYKK
ncbi:MAG: hypothetical protein LBQ31_08090 [Bacteroidales bacterium]|jgi:hypothetical protein|nr:hypothetical protein [Bacteroidales bacterium]